MNSRVETGNPSILPWQVPVLEGSETWSGGPAHAPSALRAVDDGEQAASEAAAEASEIAFEEVTTTSEEIASAAPRDPVVVAPVAEQDAQQQAARSYAHGHARGLEEGRTQGYAEGHAEGHAAGHAAGFAAGQAEGLMQGRQAGQAALAAQARRLVSLVERLDAPIPALERVVEEAVIALALEVARAVIGAEVSQSRDYLVQLIREAVAKVPVGMGKPRLVMNFADLALIQSLAPDIEEQRISLVGDDLVEPGGCIVVANAETADSADRRWHPRTSDGISQVDLTLPARWRAVMRTLFEDEKE